MGLHGKEPTENRVLPAGSTRDTPEPDHLLTGGFNSISNDWKLKFNHHACIKCTGAVAIAETSVKTEEPFIHRITLAFSP